MKKVRCVDSIDGKLTAGKLYEIVPQWRARASRVASFYIRGDDGVCRYYDRNFFIDIEEDRESKLGQLGI